MCERIGERFFTAAEADEEIGKTIESLVDFSGIPKGTRGKVKSRYPAGINKWGLDIAWDRPGKHPLHDGFSKNEYERFLVVIP